MGVFSKYFPLGLGTTRFPVSGPNDVAGLENSIALARHAIDSGINYIDTAYSYSSGMANTVLKEVFAMVKKPLGVTVKVAYGSDKTADKARRRVETQLKSMGLSKAQFFVCWTIYTYEEFEQIMQKGGVYEGAQIMKQEGLIDHICFSTHAKPDEITKIIKSGAFEGVTLSYNLTNAVAMLPVLDTAYSHGVDVSVMNPLGGGVIPQNPGFFSFAKEGDTSVIQAALCFVAAHPAVKIVLSGMNSIVEIDENISSFTSDVSEKPNERLNRVMKSLSSLPGFCTSCNYCAGCPKGIPISEIMRKRNSLHFPIKKDYNRNDQEVLDNIKVFYPLVSLNEWFPNTPDNPCVLCGQCNEKCTQRLNVIDGIADVYRRVKESGYSKLQRKERLKCLLHNKGYTRVGLYPSGGFAQLVVSLYNQLLGPPTFEWLQFNSNPKTWGKMSAGMPVYSPADIPKLSIDIIVICSYKFDAEIYETLHGYEKDGIKVVKLHRETDVPWIY